MSEYDWHDLSNEEKERLIKCYEAMKDIRDPAAFVKAVDELMHQITLGNISPSSVMMFVDAIKKARGDE